MLAPDRRLQARIAGAFALVVAINGLLLAALGWSAATLLSRSGHGIGLDPSLERTVGAILLGAIGLVAVQARYGTHEATAGLDPEPIDGGGPRDLGDRVGRLAAQADVPTPSVAVADREEPTCLTVGTPDAPTILVTTGLLDRLADDELDAALAHEVAHVANRDLFVVTAIAAVVGIGDRLLERERLLRRVLHVVGMVAIITGSGILLFAVPLLVLGGVYLLVSAVSRSLLAVNGIALGLFAKAREYAADRGACQLTGEPAALASALETLEDGRPRTDKRLQASATLGIVHRPLVVPSAEDEDHWLEPWLPDPSLFEGPEAPEDDSPPGPLERAGDRVRERLHAAVVAPVTARVRRLLAWRPATHPPVSARVERLRRIERGRDR